MSSSTGTGTPSRRRSALEDRLAAFKLGPNALQHLERSDRAHDEAMTSFLGQHVRYGRS